MSKGRLSILLPAIFTAMAPAVLLLVSCASVPGTASPTKTAAATPALTLGPGTVNTFHPGQALAETSSTLPETTTATARVLARTSTESVLTEKGNWYSAATIQVGSWFSRVFTGPDLREIAYVVREGEKQFVVSRGQEGKRYDTVLEGVFSPDGKHFAYSGMSAGKWLVVMDGLEGQQYDGVQYLIFSPDSQHLAYVAQAGDRKFMVMDGQKGHLYDEVAFAAFSPDSQHFAYSAIEGKKWSVVLDGVEGKQYDTAGFPTFSPDSRHLAYAAQEADKGFVVVDGREGQPYDGEVFFPTFSPDDKHLAYFVGIENPNRWFVVLDGEKGPEYNIASFDMTVLLFRLVFSPDSKRLAYFGLTDQKGIVVADGKEISQYDGNPVKEGVMWGGFLAFSPDSRRLACTAYAGDQMFVVVDGEAGNTYDRVGTPVFSPDSQHIVYTAIIGKDLFGGKSLVVVDGTEGKQYDAIAVWTSYFGIMARDHTDIQFDSSNSFHYIGAEDSQAYLVQEKIE